MKLLLDTQVWNRSLLEPERLVFAVRSALYGPGTKIWLALLAIR